MIDKLVQECFDDLQKIYVEVGLYFWELSDSQEIAMKEFIRESLYSPRWTDVIYPKDALTIKQFEMMRWTESKYKLLVQYDIPFKLFDHGNVLGHTLFLIKLLDVYPSHLHDSELKTLKKAFIIHDLSEVKLWDHSHNQWQKTPEFKQAEKIAGREIITTIYKDWPVIQQEMLAIDDQLDDKQGRLYKLLKVYEEMSHLLWSIEVISHGFYIYHDVLEGVQWHIDKLLWRKDEYPFVQWFLLDVKNKLPDNNFGSIE